MRLPTSTTADMALLRRTAAALQAEGKMVSPANVAELCELSESRVETLLALNNHALSIDQPLMNQDQDLTLAGVIADKFQDVEDDVWQAELEDMVERLLRTLSEREANILMRRFGLRGVAGQSLEMISKDIGLSRERIRQIEKKVLQQLKDLLGEREWR